MITVQHRSSTRGAIKVVFVFALAIAIQGAAIRVLEPTAGPETANAPDAQSNFEARSGSVFTQTFVVVNSADKGEGSLRQAILDANESVGRDRIIFAFFEPVTATITLDAPLPVVTDAVVITGGDGVPTVTVDGSGIVGQSGILTVTNTNQNANGLGTTIRGLRFSQAPGSAIAVLTDTHTLIEGNVFDKVGGGVRIQGGGSITLTNNLIGEVGLFGIHSSVSNDLLVVGNTITQTIGADAIILEDAVTVADIISNTIFVVSGDGLKALGDPAPSGIQVRGNVFNVVEGKPINYGPGVNGGFPAPLISGAGVIITRTLSVEMSSQAEPGAFDYPLSLNLYRVRNNTFEPFGPSREYSASDFPEPKIFVYTPTIALTGTDLIAAIATTSNPSTSEFSDPRPVVTTLPVTVDVKPGSDPNSFNCTFANGVIPVAVLTDVSFDALDIDHNTVRFGSSGTEAAETHTTASGEAKRHEEDVDGDGQLDLVFHFELEQTGLTCDDEEAKLTGETFAGLPFQGQDSVRPVPDLNSKGEADLTVPTELAAVNYPDPFNQRTTFELSLPEAGKATLIVRDILGREVARIVDRELSAGRHAAYWDARGHASGMYLYELRFGDQVRSGRMILLK